MGELGGGEGLRGASLPLQKFILSPLPKFTSPCVCSYNDRLYIYRSYATHKFNIHVPGKG